MDTINSSEASGSLQISSEVIEKIARLATTEVEGVNAVAVSSPMAKKLLDKIAPPNPIQVELKDEVADIEISIVVNYGTKIPELSEKIQQNVKNSIQNMTSITVGRVNIIVNGIAEADEPV